MTKISQDSFKKVICDIETDDLKPTLVRCIVCIDVDTNEEYKFLKPFDDFIEFAKTVDTWIGHNFIKFDYWRVLRVFFPEIKIHLKKIIDTLVLSRLFRYDVKGGHGLEAWGERCGIKKPTIESFKDVSDEELLHRCLEDARINLAVWRKFEKAYYSDTYKKAIELEMAMEWVCLDMEENGFPFDIKAAKELREEITKRLEELDNQIRFDFKPRAILIKEVTPKLTKKGTLSLVDFRFLGESPDLSLYQADSPFSLFEYEPFNPASPKQIVERLNEAGWKPFEKTKSHIETEREIRKNPKSIAVREKLERFKIYGWSINEANLGTLPEDAPEGARKLAERILLASRASVLTEWINAYRDTTESVHGRFNGIGAWTHRMSHQAPNQANIPSDPDVKDRNNPSPYEKLQLQYGVNLRKLWGVRPKEALVGTDADGIQLRILGHYMEDEEFINALVSGDKSIGTDVHSLNAVKLGIGRERRDAAKTFIYAFLLGAGVDKVAKILQTSNKNAAEAVKSFIESTPGLKELKEKRIPRDAERGYFVGLDGRLVPAPSEHHVLAGYLQNGEATIMKTGCLLWRRKLREDKVYFRQVDFVHDEWQTITHDDEYHTSRVSLEQQNSITEAGVLLSMKCPLIGQSKIGYNWKETH